VVIILFLFFNLSKYFQINFTTYLKEEDISQRPPTLNDSKEINTLFIGFDDTQNTYKFINMLAIVSLDYQTASVKIYNLNPNYLVDINNNSTTIRTSFNFLTSSSPTKMNDLMRIAEDVSAIRIDRYIAVNYSNMNKLVDLTSMNLESDKSYKLGDTFISEGENLKDIKLANFITYGNIPDDNTIERQSMFLKELFENLRDNFTLYRYFLDAENFSKIINTDFSKDEFLRFIVNIAATDSTIQTSFASNELTLSDLTKLDLEDGIKYSHMLLDEDISGLFRNIPIIKEQAKLEIFNATEESGVAYTLKRKFENTGITVIKTGNYPDTLSENILYLPKNNPDNFVNTIRSIRSILRDNLKVVYGDYKFNYSGDMILVIGDY